MGPEKLQREYTSKTKVNATLLPPAHPNTIRQNLFGENMEKLLNEQVVGQIKQAFADLVNPVQILFFGSKENCDYCNETQQLLSEISAADGKVNLSTYDLHDDASLAAQYKVDKAPAIVVASKDGDQIVDLGVQFSGIPAGYEFSTLITDIILASKRDSGLGAATREFLKTLTQPLLLQVFVTPT
jgi:alkyl hydroperoxide reductase subunit AhpF